MEPPVYADKSAPVLSASALVTQRLVSGFSLPRIDLSLTQRLATHPNPE
jgi:hypothetical protein